MDRLLNSVPIRTGNGRGRALDDIYFYFFAAVPLLGVAAQWIAWRYRLPSILLLLAFGIGLGSVTASVSDGEEIIPSKLLFPIVSLSVAIILFEGGLSLRIHDLREQVGRVVFQLCTVGALISWILTAAAAIWLLGLHWRIAALIGAILVVTGPTVVAPLLRHIRPSRNVASVVKWEGIVIDPVGAVLAVLVFEAIGTGDVASAAKTTMMAVAQTIVFGGAIGCLTAWILIKMVKHFLAPEYLQSPIFLVAVVGAFGLSNYFQHESGLLAVTVLGVVLANQKSIQVRHVAEFKENLQVLLIACLFILLGARIDLVALHDLGWRGMAFLAALIVIVRPVSVCLATVGSKLSASERAFLCCLAPRGIVAAAVSSVFALRMASHSSSPEAAAQIAQIVPVTFLVIIGTVAFYGLLAAPLARRLKLSEPNPQGVLFAGASPWIRDIARSLQEEGVAVILVDTNYSHIASAKMEGLPAQCVSILSDQVQDEIDLGSVGRLLAVTPNDEVNALAVQEFVHVFGRQHVYQLPPSDTQSGPRASVGDHLLGRNLFGADVGHEEIERRLLRGDVVKRTSLTEEFPFERFQERYAEAIPLFIVAADKSLHVCTAEHERSPQAGETVIAIVRPESD